MVIFMTGMVVAQNTATTNQEGNNNTGTQVQTGDDNNATIHQGDFKGTGTGMDVQNNGVAVQTQTGDENTALIQQRSGSWGTGNTSTQTQVGEKNTASMTFFNGQNLSTQVQVGDENWSYGQISQSNNIITTTQTGDRNWAKARLLNSDESEAMIQQVGSDNKGEVYAKGVNNNAQIRQNGNMHDAYQMQNGMNNKAVSNTGLFFNAEETSTEQYQEGDGNLSRFEMQKGNRNYAKSDQDGDNNHVFYRVRGNDNSAEFMQESYSPGNVASAVTNGDDNVIEVEQLGTNNMVGAHYPAGGTGIEQDGDRNETYLKQEGSDNFATVDQMGTENILDYDVFGYNNHMEAVQEDEGNGRGNMAIIDQTWYDKENYGNEIFLTQRTNGGAGNRAYMKLKGDENEINVTQSGSWNQVVGKGMFPDVAYGDVTDGDMFKYEGDKSDIDFTQAGNQNLISGEIHNSYGDIMVDQQGNVNKSFINVGPGLKFNNDVTINQWGNSNLGNVSQMSNGNSAVINQMGNSNTSTISQQ